MQDELTSTLVVFHSTIQVAAKAAPIRSSAAQDLKLKLLSFLQQLLNDRRAFEDCTSRKERVVAWARDDR